MQKIDKQNHKPLPMLFIIIVLQPALSVTFVVIVPVLLSTLFARKA